MRAPGRGPPRVRRNSRRDGQCAGGGERAGDASSLFRGARTTILVFTCKCGSLPASPWPGRTIYYIVFIGVLAVTSIQKRCKPVYTLFSVEDHIVEPSHVWTDRVPAKFKDRAPHVVEVD